MKKLLFILFLISFSITFSQELKFNNSNLERIILNKYPEIDQNKNGKIDKPEAESLKELNLMKENLENISDIVFFKNLEYLSLTTNKLENLKINNFKYLKKLYCARNNLKILEISNLSNLVEFACGLNKLTVVKIKNCPNIESLNMMDNFITEIDLKQFKNLKYLTVDGNKLKELDLSKNVNLEQITINKNELKEIDITKNQKLIMHILYIDKDVKIIGTENQMKNYRPGPIVIQN